MALKHIGRFKENGRKVAVIFRTLPDDPESALVVQTENLGDAEHVPSHGHSPVSDLSFSAG